MKFLPVTKLIVVVCVFILTSCTLKNTDVSDIKLQTLAGEVQLSQFSDKVILLSFGYTHCPDICPATLSHLAQALELLSVAEKASVQSIFVTLDPERDNLETLDEYVHFFDNSIIGASLDATQEKTFLKAFQIEKYKEGIGDDYTLNHSTYLYLIDSNAKILDMMGYRTTAKSIAEAVRSKIKE